MLFWRFLVAAFFTFIILMFKGKNIFQPLTENLKIIFYGIAFYGTSSITYFIGSNYIGTGLTMVVFFIYPAIVMLFNWILYNEGISKTYYLAFSMIIVGILLLADLHELKLDFLGIGFGILSAICYACYVVASKKSNVSPLISTSMVLIGCSIACLIVACFEGNFVIPDRNNWLNITFMAIICTALPILLLLKGLKYISSEKAAIVSVLEPVFVLLSGIILLGETVSVMQIFGTIIILSGAVITLFSKNSTNQK
ncbi:MAG: DMT family transporter [Alphaproteobacteria bacterium]|jgi:drug/metabolite transporter (DMT)-like permease|nr:DMT family transporter [Alphaproteobacteria bacterium]